VRLYLVLSVVFFSISVSSESGKHAKRGHETPAKIQIPAAAAPPAGAPGAHPDATSTPAPAVATPKAATPPAAAAKPAGADQEDADDSDSDVTEFPGTMGDVFGTGPGCDHIVISGSAMLERAVRESCWRNSADNGATFLKALIHNAPKMMFAFLPLMAGVMALLYWWPRRFYVEHLVFLLHNHSALYLWFVLVNLTGLLASLWHPLAPLVAGLGIATFFYVVWYPYAAMRRYYRQGRALTVTKFFFIALAYLVCLLLTLVAGAVVTALEN